MGLDLDAFAEFGTFSEKTAATTSVKVNPLESFVAAANQQIVALFDKTPPDRSHWFKVGADGTVTVILRTGIRVLPLKNDSNQMVAKDRDHAVKYLQKVIHMAQEGKLNEAFARAAELTKLATAGKKPAKKAAPILSDAEIAQRIAANK